MRLLIFHSFGRKRCVLAARFPVLAIFCSTSGWNSPAGSRVVFDYILHQVIEGRYEGLYAASKQAKGLASVGEPFVTGWTPVEAHGFIALHALRLIDDLDDRELTRRYLIGSNGKPDGKLPDWMRIIDAEVR